MTQGPVKVSDEHLSTPWEWSGGYPQRITNPAAILLAEVWEDPDAPATIAPLICDAVNAYIAAAPDGEGEQR